MMCLFAKRKLPSDCIVAIFHYKCQVYVFLCDAAGQQVNCSNYVTMSMAVAQVDVEQVPLGRSLKPYLTPPVNILTEPQIEWSNK